MNERTCTVYDYVFNTPLMAFLLLLAYLLLLISMLLLASILLPLSMLQEVSIISTASNMDVQGVFLFFGHEGCTPFHHQQCELAGCIIVHPLQCGHAWCIILFHFCELSLKCRTKGIRLVRYRNETQSGTTGMLLCRTQIPDPEMTMPSSQRTPELQRLLFVVINIQSRGTKRTWRKLVVLERYKNCVRHC
jgi:hypothetical protein